MNATAKDNAGQSSFPVIRLYGDGTGKYFPTMVAPGLTKRELFAAMAMQGIMAYPDGCGGKAGIAKYSVEIADSLLEELAKEGDGK